MLRWPRSLGAWLALAALAACGGDKTVTPEDPCIKTPTGAGCPKELVGLETVPSQVNIVRRGTQSLSVQFRTRDGNVAVVSGATWTSASTAIATVSGNGPSAVVTGQGRGTTTVSAQATTPAGQALSANASVLVRDVASVTVLPDTLRLVTGASGALTATVTADTGVARAVRWSTANVAVASVDTVGRVTAVAAGSTNVLATSTTNESILGRAVVLVTDPAPVVPSSVRLVLSKASVCGGNQLTATATPLDGSGLAMSTTGLSVTWSATNATIAPVTPPQATAFVANVGTAATGGAQVTALILRGTNGVSQSSTFQVLAPIGRVDVTLASASIGVLQTTQGNAVVRDCEGAAVTGKVPTWTSANQGIATVSPSGVVSGVASGTTTISATVDGVVGSASITVATDPIAQIVAVSATTLPNETIFGQVLEAPAVKVTRQSGAAAALVPVLFTTGAGGGTVAPAVTVNTDGSGIARLGSWTLGGTIGTQTLSATAAPLTAGVTFSATALAPVIQPAPQISTCRAQLNCAFALTLLNNRSQPLPGAVVALVADGVPPGSRFEHAQLTSDAQGFITTTWFLPERKVYTGRATVGPASAAVSREAVMPNFTVGVVQGSIEKLQRGGAPIKVGGLTVTLNRRNGGSAVSQPSTSTGTFDSGDLAPGTYDGVIPVSVGVVRAVRFYNVGIAGGQVVNIGNLRVAAGTAGGPLKVCLVGPLNTDPATSVVAFDGSGGDGNEAGRASVTYSPDGNGTGCFDGSLQEGEYMLRVQRTGRADFRIPLIVDTGTFPAPTKTIGIP